MVRIIKRLVTKRNPILRVKRKNFGRRGRVWYQRSRSNYESQVESKTYNE